MKSRARRSWLEISIQHVGQHIYFAGQRTAHYQLLALVDQLVRANRAVNDAVIQIGKRAPITPIDEDPVDQVREVISHCSVDRPLLRQMLARLQNLLHQQIERRLLRGYVVLTERRVHIQFDSV